MRSSEELLALLGPGVEAAVVAGVEAAGIERPFVVDVRLRPDENTLFARVGAEAFRDRTTRASAEDGAAVDVLYRAKPPHGLTFELAEHADPETLAALAEVAGAFGLEFRDLEQARARALLDALGRDVAGRLNTRAWPGAAEPFLALVRIADPYGSLHDIDPYALAIPSAGVARVDAFRASIRSARAETGPPPATARQDRAALAAALGARGLPEEAERVAALAERGFRLEEASEAQSRLGGSGLLPPGEAWPHDAEGRPLTFLAGLDLGEFDDARLPGAGWLLFFADLDNDDAEGFVDEADNVEGAKVRVFFVPDGAEPVAAEGPATLVVTLAERRVRGVPRLTLADGHEAGEAHGLDPAACEAYDEMAMWLMEGDDGDNEGHWVLGARTGTQGFLPEAGTVLLLHLGWDEALGFEFLDGGDVQFRIPEAALAAGDWSAVVATGDSC